MKTRTASTPSADAVIGLPRAPTPLPVILNTVAGHLWGYYAALSIDEDALFVREFRNQLNLPDDRTGQADYPSTRGSPTGEFRRMIRDFAGQFHENAQRGRFPFTNAKTLSDLVLLLKYAVGKLAPGGFLARLQ